jgi:hypothetical protein
VGYLVLFALLVGAAVVYWPITLGLIALAIYWIARWFQRRRRVALAARRVQEGLLLLELGQKVEVVGEGSYQGNLFEIGGGRTANGVVRTEHVALLWPEPENKHDPNAVRVVIENAIVGYLSKGDAAVYQAPLARALTHNRVPAAHAELRGGWDRGPDDRGSIGVVLHLGTPEEVAGQVDRAIAT